MDLAKQEATQRQELLRSEEQYRSLVQNSIDGFLIGLDNKIQFIIQAATKMLGFSSEDELLGRTVQEFDTPEFRALEFGEVVTHHQQVKLIRKDGSEILVDHGISRIMYRNKEARQCAIRDLTKSQTEEMVRHSSEANPCEHCCSPRNQGVREVRRQDT